MNQELLLFHVGEAEEELLELLKQIRGTTIEEETMRASFLHVYHHLNSAWNTRFCESHEEANRMFYEFRQFPPEFEEDLADS